MYLTINRDDLVTRLHEGILEITFDKLDGERRVLLGTLLLEDNSLLGTKERTVNRDTVQLWDKEKEAWRSIRLDRIVSIKEVGVV